MKRLFIVMAMLTGIVTGAIAFSSFVSPRQKTKEDCSLVDVNVPKHTIIYEGRAVAGRWDADPKEIKVQIILIDELGKTYARVWLINYDMYLVNCDNAYSWVGTGYEVVEYRRDDGSTYYGVYYNCNEYFAYPPR